MAVAGLHRRAGFSLRRGIDIWEPGRLYNLNSARRRLGAVARLRSSSMILVTRHPIAIGGHKLRRLSGLPGGGTALVPGCLTGESEERETWTAESLRAASPNGDTCLQGGRPDETSAVDVSGQHPVASGCRACDVHRAPVTRLDRSGTSSNVVIGREKFSSNLRV